LRNNGDGTYAAKVDYGVGSIPRGISLGDIDNDGDLDIAVANYNSNTVSVLKNRNRSADIVLSSNSFFFGDVKVDSSKTLYLKINNDGIDSTLTGNLSLGLGSVFSLSKTSFSIPGLGVDSVGVTFKPTSKSRFEDSVIVTSNDLNKPKLYVKLVGNGVVDTLKPISFLPGKNALNVDKATNIEVTFSKDVDPTTLTSSTVKIQGSQSGLHQTNISYTSATKTATIDPLKDFIQGEVVSVTLTRGIRSTTGDSMSSSYTWSFTVKVDDGSGSFVRVRDIGVGDAPHSVHTSDLDGDGDIDIVVANRDLYTVSILRNDGGLSFVRVSDISVGSWPVSVHTSDLDGDGDIDIVVANLYSYTVSILRNDGGLSFVRVGDIGVGNLPSSVYTSDLDGDGDVDIIVANASSNAVSILRNDGGLSFVRIGDIGVGSGSSSVHTSDLDGDGDIDIVANWGSNTVSILRNDGGLNFVKVSDISVGTRPWSVHTSDLDGDRDIDIVVAGSYTALVLRNDGGLNFIRVSDISVGARPRSVHASDLDGDGDIDIVVANEDLNTVSIFRNDGSLSFVKVSDINVGSEPYSVYTSDLDGDGDVDIVVANWGSDTISILRNSNRGADISLDKKILSFGDVSVGGRKSLYLKIYNDGVDSVLSISLPSVNLPFSVSRASLSIPPLGLDSVEVVFSPSVSGEFIDSLMILSNDPREPRLVVRLVGYSGNYVSGVITENTVWTRSNSPYIVSGHIGVDAGVKLRIESGVRVVFKGRYNFNVDGILEVEGAEGDSVVFTSLYPDTMRYPGIRFRSGSSGSFRYARVEYSDNGIWANGSVGIEVYNSIFESNGYGISDTSSNLTVLGSKFLRNGVGVRVSSVSNVSIDSCIFEDNTSDGVNFYSSNGYVRYSNFVGNGVGVRANSGSVEVSGNRFYGNTSGIYVNGGTLKIVGNEIRAGGSGINHGGGYGYLEVVNNVISDNSGWGMYLYGVNSGIARGNLVSGNGSGVYIWDNGGVNFERNRVVNNRGVGLETNRDISIRENVISGNLGDGINTRGNNQILYNDIFNNFGDGIEASSKPVVNYNNIWGNGEYDFRATLQASDSIDARNNWWGTASRSEIRLRIYDFYDDGVTVRVRFEPYYSEKVGMLAVTGFRAESRPGGEVRFSWDRHPFASRYALYSDNRSGVLDTNFAIVEVDSSVLSYSGIFADGYYRFGIRAISYDGRKSPLVVLDSVVSDSRSPVLVYAFGVQRDSVITVKFNEAVDFSSIFDVVNWEVKGLGVKKVKVRNGLIARYYNYSGDTSNVTLVRVDTVSNINYYWYWDSPGVGVNSDNFKIVYEGLIYIPEDGNYWFRVEVDDIFKMWIDDVVVLSGGYGSETWVNLTRGFHKFRGEYIEYSGDAYVRLYWRNWGEIVPGDNFYLPSQVSFDLVLDGLLPSADSLIYVRVRNVKDLVGNVSGEQVYEFYPDDGNSNPKVVLSRITAEVSGDVRIGYVVSDLEGDSVRLRVEYSVNGVDWNRASIVGDTLIGRSRYSGYLIWRSGLDLPNYGGDVIFRITPRDNDPHNWGEGDRIILRVDNYHGHRVSFVLVD
ncbi:parallel beta-helix repeat (two copies), partial [Candidatus Kryptonium thompsonii]